MSQQSKIKNLI